MLGVPMHDRLQKENGGGLHACACAGGSQGGVVVGSEEVLTPFHGRGTKGNNCRQQRRSRWGPFTVAEVKGAEGV